jgi:hypothetical protein
MENANVNARYRCELCGNITRFDVVESVTLKTYYHYAIDGQLDKEEPEILSRRVESVSCRWCNSEKNVEEVTSLEQISDNSGIERLPN